MNPETWATLRARPLLFPTMFALVGIGVWPRTSAAPELFLSLSAVGSLLALGLRGRTGAHLILLLSLFLLGVGAAGLAAQTRVPDDLPTGQPLLVEGTLEAVRAFPAGVRWEVAVARAGSRAVRFRAALFARGPEVPALLPGQRLLVRVRLKRAHAAATWGQYDPLPAMSRRGLAFTGSVDSRFTVPLSGPAPWRLGLDAFRRRVEGAVQAGPGTDASKALFLTLAIGARAALGEDLEERFSRAGLAHVLSVSGLHVAILAMVLLRLVRAALVRAMPRADTFDVRRYAAPLCIPLVWAYVALTGWQAPAVRSAVMASAVLVGMALWQRSDLVNGLCLAGLALCLVDPSAICDLSVQLSFVAVGSLAVLAPRLRRALPCERPDPSTPGRWRYRAQKLRETVVQTFCASLAVILACAPLVANAFHQQSVVGLLSNMVSLPLCAALTALAAFTSGLFAITPALAAPLFFAGNALSELLLLLVNGFAGLPFAVMPLPSFAWLAAAAWFAGWTLFSCASGREARAGLVAALLALTCSFAQAHLGGAPVAVTFLSVGQGDAVVIESRGQAALVDAGGTPGGGDPGKTVVTPYLRHAGIRTLELAVLSHPHPDHALGLISTLTKIPTRNLWLAAGTADGDLSVQVMGAAGKAAVEEVERGRSPFQLGDALIEVIGPPADRLLLEGVNDRSLVLRVRHGQVSFLLTGDIEAAAEEILPVGATTVVKAPHHGSATSSSNAFVEKTRPRVVVFCVGLGNRFRFPNPEVVQRYQAAGAQCFRTDLHGAVRVESDGANVRVKTFHPSVADDEARPYFGVDDSRGS